MIQDERGYFEDFLREQTEGFRMNPHARVWKSIYNNVHPNRKWPAVSTLFVFFCAFLMLGGVYEKSNPKISTVVMSQSPAAVNVLHEPKSNINVLATEKTSTIMMKDQVENLATHAFLEQQPAKSDNYIDNLSLVQFDMNQTIAENQPQRNIEAEQNHIKEISAEITPAVRAASSGFENKSYPTNGIKYPVAAEDESAFSYQVYATPSYGYRSFGLNQETGKPESHLTNATDENAANTSKKNNFSQINTWNIEAGGALLWSINSMIRLKAGMQVNYSSYSNDEAETGMLNKSTAINNADVSTGNSYQISMPMGTEFELTGNKVFQWYAGATIQPSYLFGTNAIALHSDMKNIMQDPSMLRRWNVNTSFETYMSYKMKNGLVINAGPQFRYQLLSSFDRSFLYTEKLYNLGMKLGISKGF